MWIEIYRIGKKFIYYYLRIIKMKKNMKRILLFNIQEFLYMRWSRVIKENMEVFFIPKMITIHTPIITIDLKIIPSINFLIIFISDVRHNILLLYVIQVPLNIVTTIPRVVYTINDALQMVMHIGLEGFNLP
jgi:hypothetical protein